MIKDVKFKLITDNQYHNFTTLCSSTLSKKETKDTVLVRYFVRPTYSGLDFILCSTGPIQSWSMGYPEHYDEIVKKFNWVEENSYYDWEMYTKYQGVDRFLNFELDGHIFSQENLNQNMKIFLAMISSDYKDLYYNSNYESFNQSVSDKRKEHFSTDKPIYYNEH